MVSQISLRINKFGTATDYPADRSLITKGLQKKQVSGCWDQKKPTYSFVISAHLQGMFVPTPLSFSNSVKHPTFDVFQFHSPVEGYNFFLPSLYFAPINGTSTLCMENCRHLCVTQIFLSNLWESGMPLSWLFRLKLDNTEVYVLISYLCTVEITTETLLQRAPISWYCWIKKCSLNTQNAPQ